MEVSPTLHIRVTSHERQGVLNYQQLGLSVQPFVQEHIIENI